jgi:transcriptional regulator with XRE-family HTH domain
MKSTKELDRNTNYAGDYLRKARKEKGISLRSMASQSGLSTGFLSGMERGKETAEIGKVLKAMEFYGLKINITHQPNHAERLTEMVGTTFPYDWSNTGMDADLFIQKVISGGRFDDLLKTTTYFGFDRVIENINHTTLNNPLPLIEKMEDIMSGAIKGRLQKNDSA